MTHPHRPPVFGRTVALILSACALMAASPSLVFGQGSSPEESDGAPPPRKMSSKARRVLWLLEVDDALKEKTEGQTTDIPALFASSLAGSRDEHVVATGPKSLTALVSKSGGPTPACLSGAAPCTNPTATAMEALGADIVLRATLSRTKSKVVLSLGLIDPAGRRAFERAFAAVLSDEAPNAVDEAVQKLILSAARDVFEATGQVLVETSPAGARVLLNGLEVGRTPLKLEAPVGNAEVEVSLKDYRPDKRTVSITPGSSTTTRFDLSAQSASLIVDVSPAEGAVYLDNVEVGLTGTTLEVMPGQYELEVRADGYRSRRTNLVLAAEEKRVMSLSLDTVRPRLRVTRFGEVSTEAIMARRYWARAGYRFSSVSSGMSGAEGQTGGRTVKLRDLTEPGGATPIRPVFGYHGFNVDAGVSWERWGLVALGFAMLTSGDGADGEIGEGDEGQPASLSNFLRLEFKPLQLTYRHAYKNLLPSIQTGFGVALTTFDADTEVASVALSRGEVFWHFSIETSYFFAPWWFGFAGLGVQRDLNHDDSDTQFLMTVGAGLAFDSPAAFLAPADLPPKEY